MYVSSRQLDLQISFVSASLLRLIQVFGLGFLFVPINLISYVGMPAEKSSSVAGLVNFMRNIGSSVGTSMVTTLIARRAQVHQAYLVAHVTRAAGLNLLKAGRGARGAPDGVGRERRTRRAEGVRAALSVDHRASDDPGISRYLPGALRGSRQ